MSKSRISPNFSLFQLVIQDFKHRQPVPKYVYLDKTGKTGKLDETIPEITKLKWAKNGKRAKAWGRKFGSVIRCFKVDSHMHRLQMIEYLSIEPRPMEVEFSVEEFTIGRDSEVKPKVKYA